MALDNILPSSSSITILPSSVTTEEKSKANSSEYSDYKSPSKYSELDRSPRKERKEITGYETGVRQYQRYFTGKQQPLPSHYFGNKKDYSMAA